MKVHRHDNGFVLLIEMLTVCSIFLTICAMAIPNVIQIQAGANQTEARTRVLQVFNTEAAITICRGTLNCVPYAPLNSLLPQPGTVQMSGYTYTFATNDDGTVWSYTATPINPGFTGHASYSASQLGFQGGS